MSAQCYFESHRFESEDEKEFKLIELIKRRPGNTLIYCATLNAIDYVCKFLSVYGHTGLRYHPRLSARERWANLARWTEGPAEILVACSDLPEAAGAAHVRLVIHFNYPASMQEYIRETSLAGQDGLPSRCALLFLRKDKRVQKRDPEGVRAVTMYAQSAICREQLLARHMDQQSQGNCQRCDNCLQLHRAPRVEGKKPLDLDAILDSYM